MRPTDSLTAVGIDQSFEVGKQGLIAAAASTVIARTHTPTADATGQVRRQGCDVPAAVAHTADVPEEPPVMQCIRTSP